MGRIFIKDRGMIKFVHDFLLYYFFQVPEIDDHSQFNMLRVCNGSAYYRNGKLIAMSVYVPTFTIVPVQGMPGLKIKLLCNANFAYNPVLHRKGNLFLETNCR